MSKKKTSEERPDVFAFSEYKSYLLQFIEQAPQPRGLRSALALAMNCQLAYLSRILNGNADLSMEQAEMASRFLQHSPLETQYFLTLVLCARAGTTTLQKHFEKQRNQILQQGLQLQKRKDLKQALAFADQVIYYSSWQYSAVHMLLNCESYRSSKKIASALQLSEKLVEDVLGFLTRTGLALREKETYLPGLNQMHLSRNSPLISKHHANWRIRAIENAGQRRVEDLQYSSVVALAKEDIPKIRLKLIEAIEEIRSIVQVSKANTLACYMIDFFECLEGPSREEE